MTLIVMYNKAAPKNCLGRVSLNNTIYKKLFQNGC